MKIASVLSALLAIISVLPFTATAQTMSCDDGSVLHPALPDGFIDGDYALIGREPGGRSAFQGQARIETDGCAVTLYRRLDGAEAVVRGGWQRLSLPDGAYALVFRSADGGAVWSCQVSVDLDNYARLTCFRILARSPGEPPGLEALFPTATWPDSMPGKHYR